MREAPETRYLRTPSGHLAYQVTGTGEPTILYLSGAVSHVELRWEIPHLVRLHRRLETIGRVVTFDPYGMGASDPLPVPPPTIDQTVEGYLAVIDEIGADRFAIVATQHAVTQGLAIAAAAPDRVSHLVCAGGYARLWAAPDFSEGVDPALLEVFINDVLPLWGTGVPMTVIFDLEAADEAELASFGRLERAAAAPGALERGLRWVTTFDVRDRLARVRSPVLVFGVPTGLIIQPQVTRAIAQGVPGARYIDVGHDPSVRGDGLDEMMAEISEFLTGSRALAHADRTLAAVLFTDLVGSTEHASALGARRRAVARPARRVPARGAPGGRSARRP